jgi:hypothetical protein
LPALCGSTESRSAGRYIDNKGETFMKNPLDSLGQTIILGLVLTVVVMLLIHAIA